MSEPEKKPAKVEPTMSEAPVIKDSKPEPKVTDLPAPAAANSNDAKKEPVVGVSPVIDIKDGKKDPVIAPVVAPVVVPPAAEVTPPANTNVPEVKAPEAKAPEAKAPEAKTETPAPAAPAAPAAEAPAPAAPEAPSAAAAVVPAHSRKKKWLMRAFNVAAGAGVTFAAKSAAVVGMTVAGAPVWATMAGSAVAVGMAMTLFCHFGERNAAKKGGAELSPFFSKAHAKEIFTKKHANVFLKSSAFALIGSALAMGFHEGIFQDAWHRVFGGGTPAPVVPPIETAVTQPVVTQPVVPPVETVQAQPMVVAPVEVAPVVTPCLTPGEHFAQLIDGHQVSARVTNAIARAASTNAAVAAQGSKDLAYFAFNGFDGVPKDANVAVELFKQAAESGNMQAKVDLVYMQYHGLGGVPADKASALSTMKSLGGARAAHFVANWGGSAKAVAAQAFSSENIFKGMQVGCKI
jgi:hypothetical protein